MPGKQITGAKEEVYGHMRMSWARDKGRLFYGLRKNYSIWPLLVFAFGCAPSFIVYMAFHKGRNPDTIWTNKNTEPWNDWSNKREKLLTFVDFDYKNYKTGRPDFEYKKDDK
ncbi:unnamed protein product [Oppiella nova]|uniref:Uncharacterized protein n=1 Tax=Oppiella nova TaxID=334625 RepID=A0A7R9LHX1_9ACAR|nr:unnamed protein product [Oppiella nova]CAG2163832.1 unnamed protein product [Oppiella nova]